VEDIMFAMLKTQTINGIYTMTVAVRYVLVVYSMLKISSVPPMSPETIKHKIKRDSISGVMVRVLALSGVDHEFEPDRVKQKTIKLVFDVSPLSIQH
jgi:hypothetical protein